MQLTNHPRKQMRKYQRGLSLHLATATSIIDEFKKNLIFVVLSVATF